MKIVQKLGNRFLSRLNAPAAVRDAVDCEVDRRGVHRMHGALETPKLGHTVVK
jgi:hypothetical protein